MPCSSGSQPSNMFISARMTSLSVDSFFVMTGAAQLFIPKPSVGVWLANQSALIHYLIAKYTMY